MLTLKIVIFSENNCVGQHQSFSFKLFRETLLYKNNTKDKVFQNHKKFILILDVFCDCYKSISSSDEASYICDADIDGIKPEITIIIKTCRSKPVIVFSLKVPTLGIYYEIQLDATQDVQVPGFGIFSFGLYLHVSINQDDDDNVKLKVPFFNPIN